MARTEQSFEFLGDLVRKVQAGALVPAAFQRQYVWSRRDVEEMWASIDAHDPLGAVLLWRPDDADTAFRMARPQLGPVSVTPDRSTALVLDGQNRLVTLAWSMFDPETAPVDSPGAAVWRTGDDHVLVADPLTDPDAPRVTFMRRDDIRGLMMPVWKLFDNSAFNTHIRTHWDVGDPKTEAAGKRAVDWLSLLQEASRQARVVVSTIQGGDVDEARRRFLRIARVGVPMSAADFDEIVAKP